jgi:gliding motility-associated-like protein
MMNAEMKKLIISFRKIINADMKSAFLISAVLFILFTFNGFGQKRCNNPPTVTLGSTSGTTCYPAPITVSGNIFGGSATAVSITEDGSGSLESSSATSSPFSFTYIPGSSDAGKVIVITVSTNNPNGSPCKIARANYSLTVTGGPSSPIIGSITQPACNLSTGSVGLSGLPTGSDWTVTTNPGGISIDGSGSTTTINYLPPGIYTFVVTVSSGCASSPSTQAEILQQPATPSAPVPGDVTVPTCALPSGSVVLTGLPESGTWTITRYPGSIRTTDSGSITTITDLAAGTYNFSVTSDAGCVSPLSDVITIPNPPLAPEPPLPGTIIQPTIEKPTGSATLTGLPASGTWTITGSPGNISATGSGTITTIENLEPATYTFRVRNESGCLSSESAAINIILPDKPVVVITDPAAVCYPSTIDLTAAEIIAGSTEGLTYTYWSDEAATMPIEAPSSVSDGIYYIKGTTASGFFDIKPVVATVRQPPVSNAGPDQVVGYQFNAILQASLGEEETGTWSSNQESNVFTDITDPESEVRELVPGENILSWIVTNGVCPADTDQVTIMTGEISMPTLITPNGDSKNEYFIIKGIETLGHTELTIFDRRGIELFKAVNYDNSWNGVDYNDKPLINDTYFFVLTSSNGRSYSGYLVVRR